MDSHGKLLRAMLTEGTKTDCKEAIRLIKSLWARYLIADSGCNTNAILEQAHGVQREYDEEMYKQRHHVKNTFLHLKCWRGIATRYAKHSLSFLATIYCKCIMIWVETF